MPTESTPATPPDTVDPTLAAALTLMEAEYLRVQVTRFQRPPSRSVVRDLSPLGK